MTNGSSVKFYYTYFNETNPVRETECISTSVFTWQLLIYVTQLKYLGTMVTNIEIFCKKLWEYQILEIPANMQFRIPRISYALA